MNKSDKICYYMYKLISISKVQHQNRCFNHAHNNVCRNMLYMQLVYYLKLPEL